jgi:hypothetical protein
MSLSLRVSETANRRAKYDPVGRRRGFMEAFE